MKKLLSVLFAVSLLATNVASMAFVNAPERPNTTQLELVSIRAVTLQSSVTGIRNYTTLVDTTKTYTTGDIVELALVMRVKNIAKSQHKYSESIADKEIQAVIGSSTIDLSYTKTSDPVIIANEYQSFADSSGLSLPGFSGSGTHTVVNIGNALYYDKNTNAVTFSMIGDEKTTASFYDYSSLAPKVVNGKVVVAALKAKDGSQTITVNGNSYTVNVTAPDSIEYTAVFTGLVKSDQKGEMNAKLRVAGAESFVESGSVGALTIKGKYNVYRQLILGSTPTDANDTTTSGLTVKVDGKVVAQANPKAADQALGVNWAGGVSKKNGELVTVGKTMSGSSVIGENGIAVYTITDTNDNIIASVVSEYTYYDGDAAKSIALYAPDQGDGYAKRIYNNGSKFYFEDNHQEYVNDKVSSALSYFGLSTNFSATYKVMDEDFAKMGAAAVFTETIKGTYNVGATSTPSPSSTPKPTQDDTDVVVDDEDDDLVVEEDDDIPVPATGERSGNTAAMLTVGALIAGAGLSVILTRSRQRT